MTIFPERWRSFSRDISGRKILIELTRAETREFEFLNAQPPVDKWVSFCTGRLTSNRFRLFRRDGWSYTRSIKQLATKVVASEQRWN
jgi:hypothetical protein